MRSAVVLVDASERSDASGTVDGVRDAVERLSTVVDDVVVSCPAGRAEAVEAELGETEYRLATDRVPDGGVVAAIRSGCRMARGRWTFVTTPEAPVDPPALAALFEAATRHGAVVRMDDDGDHPLAAVYDTEAAVEAAEMTLGMGSRAMNDVLERLEVTVVADDDAARASD